ncbi:MAG: FAD-binding protein [Chloroflexi bacterium]|nr:FAD-binding protein [Chloroflexota bacterium]
MIVGYGGAGAVAAITVAEAGGRAILLEKAPEAGGSSAVCSGGMRCPTDARQTAQYIKNLGLGTVDAETSRVFAETWVEIKPWFVKRGARFGESKREPGPYGNMGVPDEFPVMTLESGEGYVRGCGRDLFAFLDGIVKKLGVEIMLRTPAKRLVQDPVTKEILGVIAESHGTSLAVRAKKAVVMTCGGFEANPDMLATYINPAPARMYTSGTPYNTGDGIKMVMAAGADLWHMDTIEWGTQGFKPDGMAAAYWLQPKGQGWIDVNRYGRRFRDESTSPRHAKSHLEIFDFPAAPDASRDAEWPNSPWYMVFDEKVRQAGPIILTERFQGAPPFITYNSAREVYAWSRDNSAEIQKGWIKEAGSLAELAAKMGIAPAGLEKTVGDYNRYCSSGSDPEYRRKPGTLAPVDAPPYYGVECVVSIVNTQGGPKRNARSQVVSALDGSPIPRLYAGGEFGSIWGFLYPGASNLAECIVSGIICGRNAMAEKNRE